MIELYKSDRHTSPGSEKTYKTETTFAVPENFRIVVDDKAPPRQQTASENGTVGNVYSPAGQNVSVMDDIAQTARAYGERIMTEINTGGEQGFGKKLKSRSVSLFLCGVLGIFGAHRFYEGKILTGILWLCTGGLGLIGWIIDLIILVNKPRYYEP